VTSWVKAVWRRLSGGVDSHAFVRLAQTHALSAAGDALVAIALAGSVFFNEDPNTARSKVALSLVLTMAPFAVVAPFLGPLIDRARGGRRLILATASCARALVCLLMAGALDALWLYPIAFVSLVFSKTHAVAKSASVPEIVESEQALVRANSVLAISAVLSGFIAGTIGFGISELIGAQWVLRIGALIFAMASVVAMEVGTGNQRPAQATATETAAELHATGVLRAGIAMAALRLSVGFLTFLIAFDFRRVGAPTWWFGVTVAASMVGSSAGNLFAPGLRGRIREELMLCGAGGSVCVAALVATQAAGQVANVALAFCLAAAGSTAKLAFDSLVQRDAPSAVQGRSFARFEAAFQLVWVIGALMPVALAIDTHLGYVFLAGICGGSALWYGLTRWKVSPLPGSQKTPSSP